MKYLLFVLLCALNLSASAQWWRGDFKKHTRLPLIAKPREIFFKSVRKTKPAIIKPVSMQLMRTPFNLQSCEKTVMRSAQHHMRFREYAIASYDFSELAELYIQENRLSEAKWYYLQSINISRNQNDFQHTIKSLISLALIKAELGDLTQAQSDLAEARTPAVNSGRTADVKTIDGKISFVQNNKVWLPKSELRYADAVGLAPEVK